MSMENIYINIYISHTLFPLSLKFYHKIKAQVFYLDQLKRQIIIYIYIKRYMCYYFLHQNHFMYILQLHFPKLLFLFPFYQYLYSIQHISFTIYYILFTTLLIIIQYKIIFYIPQINFPQPNSYYPYFLNQNRPNIYHPLHSFHYLLTTHITSPFTQVYSSINLMFFLIPNLSYSSFPLPYSIYHIYFSI